MPRARLTCARPPRCVTDVEVVENADGYGVGVERNCFRENVLQTIVLENVGDVTVTNLRH